MMKELRLIKSLAWTAVDKASTESEKIMARRAMVKQCRKLMTKAGFEKSDVNNMYACGRMRMMFEEKSVTLLKRREDDTLEIIKRVLDFHGIEYQMGAMAFANVIKVN